MMRTSLEASTAEIKKNQERIEFLSADKRKEMQALIQTGIDKWLSALTAVSEESKTQFRNGIEVCYTSVAPQCPFRKQSCARTHAVGHRTSQRRPRRAPRGRSYAMRRPRTRPTCGASRSATAFPNATPHPLSHAAAPP